MSYLRAFPAPAARSAHCCASPLIACGVSSFGIADADSGPDIGLYADAAGTSCNIEQVGPGAGAFYVVCELGGAASEGIKTAEFGVTGIPAEWFVSVTPSPAALTMLWNPVDGGGTIVFAECEAGDGGRVLLATINYYAPGPVVAGTVLTLTRNEHRIDPGFQCPLVKKCESRVVEVRICVPGVDAVINGASCPVGVEPATWSALKNIYRDEED